MCQNHKGVIEFTEHRNELICHSVEERNPLLIIPLKNGAQPLVYPEPSRRAGMTKNNKSPTP